MHSNITINSITLEYFTAGRGPDFLFIPGTYASYRFFVAFLKLLSEQYTVHCITLPGMGTSESLKKKASAEHFANIVSSFIVEKKLQPILCGESLGGGIAIKVAADLQNLIHKLILIDPYYTLPTKNPILLLKGMLISYYQYIRQNGRSSFGKNFLPWDMRNMIFLRPKDAFWIARILKNIDYYELSKKVSAETLIISADKDPYITPKYVKNLNEAMQNSTLEWVHNAGHNWLGYQPQTAVKYIQNFLKKT